MANCRNCNSELKEGAKFCDQCGASVEQEVIEQQFVSRQEPNLSIAEINTHLVKAILVTVLCCIPIGIVSIFYAVSANDRKVEGDYAGALAASRLADKWATWGIIGAAIVMIVYLILIFGFSATGFLIMDKFFG